MIAKLISKPQINLQKSVVEFMIVSVSRTKIQSKIEVVAMKKLKSRVVI